MKNIMSVVLGSILTVLIAGGVGCLLAFWFIACLG